MTTTRTPQAQPTARRSARDDRTDRMVAELESSLRPPLPEGRPQVLGHRGFPASGQPENSVGAVAAALRHGADGVEVDVRLTTDGALVCAHEATAPGRTGGRRLVATSARGDLLALDGRGRIATLDEVLAAARSGGSRFVVEAKPVAGAAAAVRTAHALAEVLAAAGTPDVTLSSFDAGLLAVIRATCADLPVRTALLGDKQDLPAAVVRRAREDGHDEVHLPVVGVRRAPAVVSAAHRLDLSVALWTVNHPADLRWAAGLGVDAVITDDVPGARRALAADAVTAAA